jgi:cytoskeletal protein RodZ
MAARLSYFAPDESQSHAQASEHDIGLGKLLRSARARRGLTLKQVSNETKIPLRYLEALEEDRLEALPGGLYGRAHVRAYAQSVHLDPGLLSQLERDLKTSAPIEAIPERPRKRSAAVLTRTRGLIQIELLRAAAYVEQALRKQALYMSTRARNFASWSQRVAQSQTRSAKISAITHRLWSRARISD